MATTIISNAELVLTDDLELRNSFETIKVTGTIGLLLRAYRENFFTFDNFIKTLDSIPKTSSLYITEELIIHIKNQAKIYQENIN